MTTSLSHLNKYISRDRYNLHADGGAHLMPKKQIPIGAECRLCISLGFIPATAKQDGRYMCTKKLKEIKLYNRCELFKFGTVKFSTDEAQTWKQEGN